MRLHVSHIYREAKGIIKLINLHAPVQLKDIVIGRMTFWIFLNKIYLEIGVLNLIIDFFLE